MRPSRLDRAAPALLALLGTVTVFHRELVSGFSRLQVFALDPPFQNYLLEHLWRWVRAPRAMSLWSPGFFHPQPEVLAFSEPMLGALPLYAPWRLLGLAPHVAYGLHAVLALLLTYVAFWTLFRVGFRLGAGPAALAAFLVAYGAPRAAMLNHPHLFLHYPTAIALLALLVALDAARPARSRRIAAAILPLAVAWQVYTNVYLAALLALWLVVSALFALGDREGRQALRSLPKGAALVFVLGLVVAAISIRPIQVRLERANEILAGPGYTQIRQFQPRLASWINPGVDQLLEPWIGRTLEAGLPENVGWAHRLGIGLLSTGLVLLGVRRAMRVPALRWLGAGFAAIVLLVTVWPGGVSAWPTLIRWLEPFASLRVISRVVLIGLVPTAVAFVYGVEALRSRVRRYLFGAVVAIALLEQVQVQPSYPVAPSLRMQAEIAAAVPADCDAFYYTRYRPQLGKRGYSLQDLEHREMQVDAMWAGLALGKPTLNGYSSFPPPDWPLWPVNLTSANEVEVQRQALERWLARWGLETEEVCAVRLEARGGKVIAVDVERF